MNDPLKDQIQFLKSWCDALETERKFLNHYSIKSIKSLIEVSEKTIIMAKEYITEKIKETI